MTSQEAWRADRVVGPAALAATLLLLGLHQVVSGAVHQAQQRHHGATPHTVTAQAGCDRIGDLARRSLCISRLQAMQVASTGEP